MRCRFERKKIYTSTCGNDENAYFVNVIIKKEKARRRRRRRRRQQQGKYTLVYSSLVDDRLILAVGHSVLKKQHHKQQQQPETVPSSKQSSIAIEKQLQRHTPNDSKKCVVRCIDDFNMKYVFTIKLNKIE